MIDIPINATVEVQTVQEVIITSGRVNGLYLNFDNTYGWLHISYLDEAGTIISTRFFRVSGATYGALINKDVAGNLAEIVIGSTAQFAMSLIQDPSLIDGDEVVELSQSKFMNEFLLFTTRK